jgi:hypothetical protein
LANDPLVIARPLSYEPVGTKADRALGAASQSGRGIRMRRRAKMARKLRKVLKQTRRWTAAMLNMVLLMFEQVTYGEYLGAEYMAFDPMRDYDGDEKEKYD